METNPTDQSLPKKISLLVQMKEAWQGYSKFERGILWVFFVLGGGFVILMLIATIVNVVKQILQ